MKAMSSFLFPHLPLHRHSGVILTPTAAVKKKNTTKTSASPATANIDRKTVTKQLTTPKLAETGRGSNFIHSFINSSSSCSSLSSCCGLPGGDYQPLKAAEVVSSLFRRTGRALLGMAPCNLSGPCRRERLRRKRRRMHHWAPAAAGLRPFPRGPCLEAEEALCALSRLIPPLAVAPIAEVLLP